MRYYFVNGLCLFLFMLGSSPSNAQQFVLGISTVPGQRSVLMDFNGGAPTMSLIQTLANFSQSPVTVSDDNDSLLFYSNGSFIENRYGLVMPGADSLSLPMLYLVGTGYANGLVAVDVGAGTGEYKLYHLDFNNMLNPGYPTALLLSVINPTLNNDTGECHTNSNMLLSDTLEAGYIAATRHGNGRDWWIIVQKHTSNRYYIILSTPYGEQVASQVIGSQKVAFLENGAAVFSPEGDMYVRFDHWNGLEIFYFDRCAGILSSPVLVPSTFFPDTNQYISNPFHNDRSGLSFSPSGRYLYVFRINQVYQLDMQAIGQTGAIQLVGSYDGTRDTSNNQPMLFGYPFLAPDSVVYFYCGGGKWIGSIPNPDLPAPACGFNRTALYYPGLGYDGLPQPPNYDLGRLTGSLCDTLEWTGVASGTQTEIVWELSPNPAIHEVLVSLKAGSGASRGAAVEVYSLYSLDGRLLKRVSVTSGATTRLWVGDLPAGLYLLQAQQNGYVLGSRRLAVVRD